MTGARKRESPTQAAQDDGCERCTIELQYSNVEEENPSIISNIIAETEDGTASENEPCASLIEGTRMYVCMYRLKTRWGCSRRHMKDACRSEI